MNHSGYIYIMTNKNRTTLYIGVTNNLCRRIYEHKNHLIKGSFTDKYNLEYCIYYEEFPYFDLAIKREKELKKWNRQKKEDLINKKNPEWKVLVTEKGFVREKVSFAQQVNDLLNELQHNGEIPPFSRNDSSPCGEMSEGSGGFASTSFTTLKEPPVIPSVARNLSTCDDGVIPNETQCSEEPPFSCQPSVISSEARNLNNEPSVIPSETQCSEEPPFSCQPSVISSEARNLNKEPHVISSEARNLYSQSAVVIPSEARNLNNEPSVIPSEARNLSTCGDGVIPSVARNLNNELPVISSEARNLSICGDGVIPNETQCSEEPPFSCQPPVIPSEARNQKFNNPTKKHD